MCFALVEQLDLLLADLRPGADVGQEAGHDAALIQVNGGPRAAHRLHPEVREDGRRLVHHAFDHRGCQTSGVDYISEVNIALLLLHLEVAEHQREVVQLLLHLPLVVIVSKNQVTRLSGMAPEKALSERHTELDITYSSTRNIRNSM